MASDLKIDSGRLWTALMETAAFGKTARGGIRRLALSDEDRMVREWFRSQCEAIGLEVAVDRIGNMFATRPGRDPDRAPIGFGSHLDTQPAGGKFDGVLGVLAGLEVMRTLHDAGFETDAPLTLVNWTNEEGARFTPAMLCSGVYFGELDAQKMLAGTDRDGNSFDGELERIGFKGDEPIGARSFGAFIELHIEQGPVLEAEERTIGVVTGGQGLLWYDGEITGRDSHAGTTPMPLRRDAMVALAEIALAVDRIARDHAPAGVGTIGQAEMLPGSRNTIPGFASFKGEFRHPDAGALTRMEQALAEAASEIEQRRQVDISINRIWRKDPVTFDESCIDAVETAAKDNGFPSRRMISGAGHDAFYVAGSGPTSMIFVPCKDGISHNELEDVKPEDCAAGAQVLLGAVLRLDRALRR